MQVTEAHTVVLAAPKGPLVKLDDKHYKLVDKMDALTEAVPSLIHANSLTVKGPVRFQAGTSFTGDVLVTNGEQRFAACLLLHQGTQLYTTPGVPGGGPVDRGT